ncbi:hypothetical protein Tco_0378230 [Tanacetum coccineum]
MKQYQKEVNDIRAERIANNTNLLALVAATQQYTYPNYQAPKSHKSYASPLKQSSSTRSHATTRYKGKEISKPITFLSESASEEDNDPEQAQRDRDMQKNFTLIPKYFKKIYKPTNNNLKTSLNTKNKNIDTSPRYKNNNQTGQFGNQRTVTVAGARETVGSQILYDTSDIANRFTLDREETLTLEQESISKLNKDLVKPYDYTKENSLYEIFKPPSREYLDQWEHTNDVRKKMWRKSFAKT